MDREQIDEFHGVRKTAYDALRFGTLIDRHRSKTVCQLLIMPSFQNAICWDVVDVRPKREDAQMRLHRSCWRMDVDWQALSSPIKRLKHPRSYHPTLETGWVVLNAQKLEAIFEHFRTVSIPVVPRDVHVGCDGTSYEFTVGDHFSSVRISWWCELPPEWKHLAPLIAELERLFESTWARNHGQHIAATKSRGTG